MHLPEREISNRARVGSLKGKPVFLIQGIGGCNVIAASGGGNEMEILGMGSHPGLARHTARIKNPDIQFDMLAKSQDLDPRCFTPGMVDHWLAETDRAIEEAREQGLCR